MADRYRNWLRTLGAPEDPVATDTTSDWSGISLLKGILSGLQEGGGGSMTAAEILAELLTVDGSGSGLDADLLDGNSSAAFALVSHGHAIGAITGLGTGVALALGGADLADPNADRIAFWDDSAGGIRWLTMGTGLTITGTTLDASAGGTPAAITVADEASDATCFPAFFTAATGDLGPKTNTGLTFNSSTGVFGSKALALTQGTITADAQQLSGTVTWNDAGIVGPAWKLDVTSTLSDGSAKLIDLLVGGSSKFSVRKDGYVEVPLAGGFRENNGGRFSLDNFGLAMGNSQFVQWSNNNVLVPDTGLYRNAAGIVEVNNGTAGTYRDLKARKFCTPMTSELTIAAGVVTATGGFHNIDTEADAASDDLDTINGGADGDRLVIRANNAARTVVVKDGTGNIQCAGDFSMDNTQDTMELIYDGTLTAWLELKRSDSGA